MDKEFERIYELNNLSVLRLAYSYVYDQNDAEDIVQKTFYKLYKNSKILKLEDEEIKKWLYRVCINESKDLLKSSYKKRKTKLVLETIKEESKDNNVIYLLQTIPDKYRITIYLHYYEGYKINEIAKILKKSEPSIKKYLAEGKELLRKELDK